MDWRNKINLERAVLVKTAGLLWRHVQGTFLNDKYFDNGNRYFLEGICVENIEKLPLPNNLREKVKKIIKPIGFEILKFSHNLRSMKFNESFIVPAVPVSIVWTIQGTVDTRRTYKIIINDESLDLTLRYKLACCCCLENDIAILWNQMCEEQKDDFLHSRVHSYFVQIWSRQIGNKEVLGELASGEDFRYTCEFAFILAAFEVNKEAVEFFWKKLSAKARRIALPKAMNRIEDCTFICEHSNLVYDHICYCTYIILFLFSQGDQDLLENLMQYSDHRVLIRLLDWPYQEYFLEILNSLQLTVGSHAYYCILKKLVNKIVCRFHDFNYLASLKIFLKQKTKFQKQSDQPIFPSTFDIISYFRVDTEAAFLIASYCKTVLKKDVSENIFESLSDAQEWEFLTFIIDECILKSKEEIFRSVGKVQTSCVNYEDLTNVISKIDDFLSEIIQKKINGNRRRRNFYSL